MCDIPGEWVGVGAGAEQQRLLRVQDGGGLGRFGWHMAAFSSWSHFLAAI